MELTFEYIKENSDKFKIYVIDYSGRRQDSWNFVWGYWNCATEDEAKKYTSKNTPIYAISPYLTENGKIKFNKVITGFLIKDYKDNIGFTSSQEVLCPNEHTVYKEYLNSWETIDYFKMFDNYDEAKNALDDWKLHNTNNINDKQIESIESKIKAAEKQLAKLKETLNNLKAQKQ